MAFGDNASQSTPTGANAMRPISKQVDLETYVRLKQLQREGIIPFSAKTLWRRVKDGSFPSPVKLSPGVNAWKMSDIQNWQNAQAGGISKDKDARTC